MADPEFLENHDEPSKNDTPEKTADVEAVKNEEPGEKNQEVEDEMVAPDGGWGWMVCLGAFITNFVVFGTHNTYGVIYGTLIKELGISSAETGKIRPIYGASIRVISFSRPAVRVQSRISIH